MVNGHQTQGVAGVALGWRLACPGLSGQTPLRGCRGNNGTKGVVIAPFQARRHGAAVEELNSGRGIFSPGFWFHLRLLMGTFGGCSEPAYGGNHGTKIRRQSSGGDSAGGAEGDSHRGDQRLATPNARVDAAYEHADATPGIYEIVLPMWVPRRSRADSVVVLVTQRFLRW